MRLCLNTSCFENPFQGGAMPLAEKLDIAAEAGYEEVELWVAEIDRYIAGGGAPGEVRRLLDDRGLKAASLITLTGWMADDPAALDECRRRLELAAVLGADRMVATPAGGRQGFWPLDLGQAAGWYRRLLELGDRVGVAPMFEFLGFFNSWSMLEPALAVVELADHPRAALVLDPFHLWRGGSGFAGVAAVPAERIGICHFNDAPGERPPRFRQGDADRVYPGDGVLPLVELLRTLADRGYTGSLSLELFRPEYWARPPRENIAEGLAKTRAVLAAAGL